MRLLVVLELSVTAAVEFVEWSVDIGNTADVPEPFAGLVAAEVIKVVPGWAEVRLETKGAVAETETKGAVADTELEPTMVEKDPTTVVSDAGGVAGGAGAAVADAEAVRQGGPEPEPSCEGEGSGRQADPVGPEELQTDQSARLPCSSPGSPDE